MFLAHYKIIIIVGFLSKNELMEQMKRMKKVSRKILANASRQHFGLVGHLAQTMSPPKLQAITEVSLV